MIRAIVTDIEGTTSSIRFVKEVLFPYAAEHLPDFVRQYHTRPEVREQLQAMWSEDPTLRDDVDTCIDRLLQWIAADEKRTPLKALQGMVWQHGYEHGVYRAHIYADAAEALRTWHAAGIPLYVYSSGSIAAQQLFFRYSEAGDLSNLFGGYFDTTTGPKREQQSYRKIAEAVGIAPGDILFLSDIEAELDAAKEAGMRTCWLLRPEDSTVADAACEASVHSQVESFAEIVLD